MLYQYPWVISLFWNLPSPLYILCAFPVRMCIPGEAHPHSQWGYEFQVRHIPIPSEDMNSRWGTSPFSVRMCIPHEAHLHSQWGWIIMEWTSSPGMGMCLIGNAYPHREWGCVSRGMHILTGNTHPDRGCASPGMRICLTGNGDVPHQGDLHQRECT